MESLVTALSGFAGLGVGLAIGLWALNRLGVDHTSLIIGAYIFIGGPIFAQLGMAHIPPLLGFYGGG